MLEFVGELQKLEQPIYIHPNETGSRWDEPKHTRGPFDHLTGARKWEPTTPLEHGI